MAVHKLSFNDTEDLEYQIVALHTTLVSYRLAFFLNRRLKILLEKVKPNRKILENTYVNLFSRFSFCDEKNDVFWILIENKHNEESVNFDDSLFKENNTITTTNYLLPEFKTVDYLLKIEAEENQIDPDQICKFISEIEGVTTAYSIELSKIKSKNNLIFY